MPQVPAWVESEGFLGIPYHEGGRTRAGCDCYGLGWLVSLEHFGHSVPKYSDERYNVQDLAEIEALTRRLRARGWEEYSLGEERPGDFLLLRMVDRQTRERHESHIGIVVAPGVFLHVDRGAHISNCGFYEEPYWRRKIVGFFRWP